MEPLLKHPFITAFLDIHFSVLKKYRSQMKDSVAHLALILLLLEFSCTIFTTGFLAKTHHYLTGFGLVVGSLIIGLDSIAIIGLYTTLFDELLKKLLFHHT